MFFLSVNLVLSDGTLVLYCFIAFYLLFPTPTYSTGFSIFPLPLYVPIWAFCSVLMDKFYLLWNWHVVRLPFPLWLSYVTALAPTSLLLKFLLAGVALSFNLCSLLSFLGISCFLLGSSSLHLLDASQQAFLLAVT